jgi:hypothetical protein
MLVGDVQGVSCGRTSSPFAARAPRIRSCPRFLNGSSVLHEAFSFLVASDRLSASRHEDT